MILYLHKLREDDIMEGKIRLISRQHGEKSADLRFMSRESAEKVREFHRGFAMYAPAPLVSLPNTAKAWGVADIRVKDESDRFGLNAFKVLGGSFAIGTVLSKLTDCEAGSVTFITATDGNHGRGVAWAARQFGQKSVVYLPKGSAGHRLNRIIAEGADARITDLNYDDTVRLAAEDAEKNGWILVQDTAFEGYEEIPRLIMQGYGTMALEAFEQLPEMPTHIFLQAGVGSMAASVAGFFAAVLGDKRPVIAIVEPDKADCIFRTAEADDGTRHFVSGDMDTVMAGLACGEPCTIAWDILKDCADFFISIPDSAAEKAVETLRDEGIDSGESGAAAFGAVEEILTDPDYAHLKATLGIDGTSRLLFFNTERL